MFRKHKLLVLVFSLLMAMGLMAGCGGGGDEGGGDGDEQMPATVKIGFLGPITGANASEGSAARNAFQMVFDQANEADTLPYKVEVVPLDDASKPETGMNAAQKLVSYPDLIAISGHWNSPVAEATIPICKQAGVPLMIWGAIGADLTSEANYPYVTRVVATDKQENIPLAQYIIETLGYKNIYMISDTTSYGKSNSNAFKEEMANYDATLLGLEEVQVGTTDFRSILAKAKNTNPQAIVYGGVAQEAGLVARQMKELGMNDILLFGTSGICSDDFITAAGDAAEGTFAMKPGTDLEKSEAGKKFLADYAAAGYKEPVGAFTPYAYHAAQMLLAALEGIDGAPTREKMVDAITKVDADGLLGHTTFDSIGQTTNPLTTAMVVEGGKWVPYEDSGYAKGEKKLAGQQ